VLKKFMQVLNDGCAVAWPGGRSLQPLPALSYQKTVVNVALTALRANRIRCVRHHPPPESLPDCRSPRSQGSDSVHHINGHPDAERMPAVLLSANGFIRKATTARLLPSAIQPGKRPMSATSFLLGEKLSAA